MIEQWILDPAFAYLQPYFYNHPYALRLELGMGKSRRAFRETAARQAREIHAILFPHGADAILFNEWVTEWSDTGPAQETVDPHAREQMKRYLAAQRRALAFLLEQQLRYRHATVRNLPTYDAEDDTVRRNRVVCYSDGRGFDDPALLDRALRDRDNAEIGLVSFENDCILSVYDDRGCDVVFASHEKLRAFYPLLEPYFLPYDLERMRARYLSDEGKNGGEGTLLKQNR